MEFELDLKGNQSGIVLGALALVIALTFVLATVGRPVTLYEGSTARVLNWSTWNLYKAEKRYKAQIAVLRSDVEELAKALDGRNNAVQVSLLVKQIEADVSEGVPALTSARAALYQAALDVGDWSIGILSREEAIASLELASALLQEP